MSNEAKFKVGDWVRVVEHGCNIEVGEILRVTKLATPTSIGNWAMIEGKFNNNNDYSYLERCFEPWTPRVGERVYVSRIGWEGEGVVKIVYEKNTYCVQMISGNSSGISGAFGLGSLSPVIPTVTPATSTSSPVRTVTRKEVVPGVYGDVEVAATNEDGVSIWLPANSRYTATRLRTMIATLTEIADALDSNS